jgi:hypothetical protein
MLVLRGAGVSTQGCQVPDQHDGQGSGWEVDATAAAAGVVSICAALLVAVPILSYATLLNFLHFPGSDVLATLGVMLWARPFGVVLILVSTIAGVVGVVGVLLGVQVQHRARRQQQRRVVGRAACATGLSALSAMLAVVVAAVAIVSWQ